MKINAHDINTSGTCLQGYINAGYDEITSAFGYPLSVDFLDNKVDAEWDIEFEDGTVATIYNWKNGKSYLGAEGLHLCDIKQWNIGGYDKSAVDKVLNAINAKTRLDYPEDLAVGFSI
jgi:hypothetical protein